MRLTKGLREEDAGRRRGREEGGVENIYTCRVQHRQHAPEAVGDVASYTYTRIHLRGIT